MIDVFLVDTRELHKVHVTIVLLASMHLCLGRLSVWIAPPVLSKALWVTLVAMTVWPADFKVQLVQPNAWTVMLESIQAPAVPSAHIARQERISQ